MAFSMNGQQFHRASTAPYAQVANLRPLVVLICNVVAQGWVRTNNGYDAMLNESGQGEFGNDVGFATISYYLTFFAIMRPQMLENTFVRLGAECFAKVLDGRGGRVTKRLGPKLGS